VPGRLLGARVNPLAEPSAEVRPDRPAARAALSEADKQVGGFVPVPRAPHELPFRPAGRSPLERRASPSYAAKVPLTRYAARARLSETSRRLCAFTVVQIRCGSSRVGPARPRRYDPSCGAWPGHRSLVDDELLAQGEVLESDLAMTADKEGTESKQVQ
jgi:hypothetical protein